MLQFATAGESHGQALIAWISGFPAGLRVDLEFVNSELHRRQLGYGRGGRQKIEKDRAEALAGIRHGQTIGAPIALRIENRDWANWERAMAVEDREEDRQARRPLTAPRPGHADLAGATKFNLHDARYILERASARETAARVAIGSLAKLFLREFGCEILSHVVAVGHVRLERQAEWKEIQAVCANLDSPLRCVDAGHGIAHEAGGRSRTARGRFRRRNLRSGGARSAAGTREPCPVGRETRWTTGARDHVHSGGQGRGDRGRS